MAAAGEENNPPIAGRGRSERHMAERSPKKMNNTKKRVLTGGVMAAVAGAAALAEYFDIPAVKYLVPAVAVCMAFEFIRAAFNKRWDIRPLFRRKLQKNRLLSRQAKRLPLWLSWLGIAYFALIFGPASHMVSKKPWIVLLLLMVIAAADVGAWLFGRIMGGEKMWPSLSPGKTWSGQIAGIACGTFAAVLYGLLGTDIFLPQLMWIGISVALLSQYGDLTASWIKRKLDIKDFGNILPGHGGFMDRFDGWIFVLPAVWLAIL
jgi:dolichol kinase